MERARLFGNMLKKLSDENFVTNDMLCDKLDCVPEQLYAMLNGCTLPTFEQLDRLSELFDLSSEEILAGNREHYDTTIVHCMKEFTDSNAREEILDIIENYVKLASAVN